MTCLRLSLLGNPEVTFAGESLKFRSRKVLGLLIYLMVSEERQSREKLVDLLWPTSDAQRGMASLRNTVARLKKTLAPAGEFLIAERGYVGFDFSQPFDLDVLRLQAACTELVEGAGSPHDSLTDPVDILSLYRGDFLDGFDLPDATGFDEWITQQRALITQQWEVLFAAVAQQQLDSGSSRAALDTATRWVGIMPYSEPAYQMQMKAHALDGNQSAALRVFGQLKQLLADELGVAPSMDTALLAEHIGTGGHTAQRATDVFQPADPSAGLPRLQIPFVGRGEERRQLQICYQQAERGNPHVALIVGEAGQGKTALATTLLNWASLQNSHPDIVQGRAFEMGGHLPYQPLIDGMRTRLEEENAPEDLLDDVWLAELSQLLPELRGRYPDLPQPMAGSPDFVRARLFEALATLGIALGEKRPLILFVDDLQWADAGTLDMLLYLVQRFTAVRLPTLFLITVRSEGVLTQPALRDWIQQVSRLDALVQIDLEALPEHSLQQLLSQLAQQYNLLSDEAKQLGKWLYQQTTGSPFFVMALLQTLWDQELLVGENHQDGQFVPDLAATLARIQKVDRVPLPPTVREIVLNRLNQLTELAHTLLLVAAVVGRACTFEQLCQTAGIELFAGLPALEELLSGRFLSEAQDADRPLTIAHDNIREVVYTEAGVTKRRLYHRQLFMVLEQDGAPAAELAFHAHAANLHPQSLDYAVIAGDESLAVHAFADAVAFYEQALALADRISMPVERQCDISIHYGRALELAGRYQDALDHYLKMHQVAQQAGSKELELAALVAQGTIFSVANELSNFELGERVSQQALSLAEVLNDRSAQAKIQWNLLNVYRMVGRNEEALAAGEASLRLAKAQNLREQMAYAANDLVYVYMALGNNKRTAEMEELATDLWRELGNQPMLTDSLVNLASTKALMGAFDEALAIAEEPLTISQSLDNKWAQSFSFFPQIFVYRRRLNVQLCLEKMEQAVALAQEVGFTGAQTIIGSLRAQLLLSIGALERARPIAQTALEVAKAHIPLFEPLAVGSRILVALAANDLGTAEMLAENLQVDGVKLDSMNYFVPELAAGHFAIAQERFAFANELSQAVLALLIEQDLLSYLPEFAYLRGLALIGLGRQAEARAALYQGLEALRQTGSRLWHLEIAVLLVDLETEAENNTAATELRQEARATLDFVLEHIPEGELWVTFAAAPSVVQLFG